MIEAENKLVGAFSSHFKTYFKEWLCLKWPEFLEYHHAVADDPCKQCYARRLNKNIRATRNDWKNIERSVQESNTGHCLP